MHTSVKYFRPPYHTHTRARWHHFLQKISMWLGKRSHSVDSPTPDTLFVDHFNIMVSRESCNSRPQNSCKKGKLATPCKGRLGPATSLPAMQLTFRPQYLDTSFKTSVLGFASVPSILRVTCTCNPYFSVFLDNQRTPLRGSETRPHAGLLQAQCRWYACDHSI
jgi:hypothetical protein